MDALKARLDLRAGLTGVTVATGPLGDDTPAEAIVLVGVSAADQAYAALGSRPKDDMYDILGGIWVARPGAGEAVLKAARDRALALLAEVEADLREAPNIGLAYVLWANLRPDTLDQGMGTGTRWCELDFRVQVKARI